MKIVKPQIWWVVIFALILYFTRKRREAFWMPGKLETPFGTPLSVPYRYTTSGLSYRMRNENQLGLPTRQDYLTEFGFPISTPHISQRSMYSQPPLTQSGIGLDTTSKQSSRYVDPRLLGPKKWDYYKLNFE